MPVLVTVTCLKVCMQIISSWTIQLLIYF